MAAKLDDFEYPLAERGASGASTASIHADDPELLRQMTADARSAGFEIVESTTFEDMVGSMTEQTADVLLCDCAWMDKDRCRAMAAFDRKIGGDGQQLIVSTRFELLDSVFGCLTVSRPQILIATTRMERLLALGRALQPHGKNKVRDLSNDDRKFLLQLSAQVGRMAEKLDTLPEIRKDDHTSAFSFESPGQAYRAEPTAQATKVGDVASKTRRSLPDPRLVRSIIRQRQTRAKFFGDELFADPAWDILLDLTAAHAEHERVSVTSLCIASGVPPTTALRWITQMIEAGLLERVQDSADKRRAFIRLSDRAVDGMARYFAEIAKEEAGRVV